MKRKTALYAALVFLAAFTCPWLPDSLSAPTSSRPSVYIVTVVPDRVSVDDALRGQEILRAWLQTDVAQHWHLLPVPIIVVLTADKGDYHTQENGMPIAYVAINPAALPDSWLLAASHEVVESTVDPQMSSAFPETINGSPVNVVGEVADPTGPSEDGFAYNGSKYWLSDYAYPAWYNVLAAPPYDRVGALKVPLLPALGGQMQFYGIPTGDFIRTAAGISPA